MAKRKPKLPLTYDEQIELDIKEMEKWLILYEQGSEELRRIFAPVVAAMHKAIYDYRMERLARLNKQQPTQTDEPPPAK